jgi:predicted nucleic acid-binding protein
MGSSPVTKLDTALAGITRLAFDTSPIIYFVEAHPQYDALVTAVFERVASGALAGFTSVITLCEVLIQPLRLGDVHLQQEYRELLLQSEHFQTLAVDAAAAELAADLRARHQLRMPDALQVASALGAGCEAFLTNDLALRRITELPVLVLGELEP